MGNAQNWKTQCIKSIYKEIWMIQMIFIFTMAKSGFRLIIFYPDSHSDMKKYIRIWIQLIAAQITYSHKLWANIQISRSVSIKF